MELIDGHEVKKIYYPTFWPVVFYNDFFNKPKRKEFEETGYVCQFLKWDLLSVKIEPLTV
jgi:hypothetical protein